MIFKKLSENVLDLSLVKAIQYLLFYFRRLHGLSQKKYSKITVKMWGKWLSYKIYTKANKKKQSSSKNNYKS